MLLMYITNRVKVTNGLNLIVGDVYCFILFKEYCVHEKINIKFWFYMTLPQQKISVAKQIKSFTIGQLDSQ